MATKEVHATGELFAARWSLLTLLIWRVYQLTPKHPLPARLIRSAPQCPKCFGHTGVCISFEEWDLIVCRLNGEQAC